MRWKLLSRTKHLYDELPAAVRTRPRTRSPQLGGSADYDGGVNAPQATRPSPGQVRRWRRYLADERAEAAVYRALGERKDGAEQQILFGLADAEKRHEAHWLALLGPAAEPAPRAARGPG